MTITFFRKHIRWAIPFACCLYCTPPSPADPWQDRDRIPKELVFPRAERERVRAGYPYFERQFGEPYRNEVPPFDGDNELEAGRAAD